MVTCNFFRLCRTPAQNLVQKWKVGKIKRYTLYVVSNLIHCFHRSACRRRQIHTSQGNLCLVSHARSHKMECWHMERPTAVSGHPCGWLRQSCTSAGLRCWRRASGQRVRSSSCLEIRSLCEVCSRVASARLEIFGLTLAGVDDNGDDSQHGVVKYFGLHSCNAISFGFRSSSLSTFQSLYSRE